MINLVPPTAKKKIAVEYWIRVITVWFSLLSFAAVVSAFIMLPTYVLVNDKVSVHRNSAAAASEENAEFDTVSKSLIQATRQAKEIVDGAAVTAISDYIVMFESLQGPGIVLEKINITRSDTALEPVLLVGRATNRQTLADFRDRLLREEQVDTVDFPISNLAKDRDIPFSITVELVEES